MINNCQKKKKIMIIVTTKIVSYTIFRVNRYKLHYVLFTRRQSARKRFQADVKRDSEKAPRRRMFDVDRPKFRSGFSARRETRFFERRKSRPIRRYNNRKKHVTNYCVVSGELSLLPLNRQKKKNKKR